MSYSIPFPLNFFFTVEYTKCFQCVVIGLELRRSTSDVYTF